MVVSALVLLGFLRQAHAVDPAHAIALAVPPAYRAEALRACRAESKCRPIGLHGTAHNPPGICYWRAAAASVRRACPAGHPDDPAQAASVDATGSEGAGAAWGPRGILGLSGAYYRPQPCARPLLLDWPWVSALEGGRLFGRLHALGYCTPEDRRAAWTRGVAATAHLRRRCGRSG